MSYILEALRKAERERNPAQADAMRNVPHARFDQTATLRQLRRYRPLFVAGLCASMMIALLISIIHHHYTTTAPAAVVAATTPTPEAVTPAPQLSGIDITAVTMSQMYNGGSGPTTLDDLVDPSADAAAPADDAVSDSDTAAPTNVASAMTPAVDAPEAANVVPAPVEPVRHAPPAPTTSVERVQLDPAPTPQIPKLNDMPSDYRAAFPAISLDVHSYDSSPKKRFIMIVGKRYNEGDTLREGPRVVQIVSDGVVFEFRGEQTLFPIAH